MQQNIITFSIEAKLKALAIVSEFETGSAFGDFSALAILNDGAGISYGFSQFTHRSGALAEVIENYLELGGEVGRPRLEAALATAKDHSSAAIRKLVSDRRFQRALRSAGKTDEMRRAQVKAAVSRYLQPAIDECERLGLSHPLSLAVVYDSMTHGSWERLRDHVLKSSSPYKGGVAKRSEDGIVLSDEQRFIINYVTARDQWLASVERLAVTRYRTRFFLDQIKAANWDLKLPLNVRGVRITDDLISEYEQYLRASEMRVDLPAAESTLTGKPTVTQQPSETTSPHPPIPLNETQPSSVETRPLGSVPSLPEEEKRSEGVEEKTSDNASPAPLDRIEIAVNAAAARYDQVDRIATTITSRNDSAKSLWTTVVGSVSQTFWAVFGLVAGVPREVWLVVAIIAAVLTLMYLYRQITLGRLREGRELRL
jgi:chitosanase